MWREMNRARVRNPTKLTIDDDPKSPGSPTVALEAVRFVVLKSAVREHSRNFNNKSVSHCGLAIYIKKYLKAKEELLETQILHHAKI